MKKKLQAALTAISDIFSDTSVPPETTLEDLEEVQADIEMKIDALRSDLKRT